MPNLCIIPARALDDQTMTFKELRALLAVGLHTGRDGGGVWASNRTLAEEAGLDVRDLRRALTGLEARGYIRRIRRLNARGADTTSMLAIVLDDLRWGGGEEGRITPGEEGQIAPGEEGQIAPPNDPYKRPLKNEAPPPAHIAGSGGTDLPADALVFAYPAVQEAYEDYRRQASHGRSFDATLRAVRDGLTTGKPTSMETLGLALLEMVANGEPFNVARLRGYVRKQDAAATASATASAPSPAGKGLIGRGPRWTLTDEQRAEVLAQWEAEERAQKQSAAEVQHGAA